MEQIKLIVTDMDGTFLNSSHEMSPEFAEVYKELKKKYCICTRKRKTDAGITHYFVEIESEIGFIAENGGMLSIKIRSFLPIHWNTNILWKSSKLFVKYQAPKLYYLLKNGLL